MWIPVKELPACKHAVPATTASVPLPVPDSIPVIPDPATITYSQLHEITTAPVLTPMTTQQALAFWMALPGHFEDTMLHPVGHYNEELLNRCLASAGVCIVHGQEDP